MKARLLGVILDRMSALADPTRSRLLLVLERHELTVSELCSVLQLPQSTVSRHLRVLSDESWVVSRADGTSRRYRMAGRDLDASARRLWSFVRDQFAGSATPARDAERVRSVLAERPTKSQEFFSTAAGHWDRLRVELFGRRSELVALIGLLDAGWTVGDLGCGTGPLSELLAPFVERVIAVDESSAMLRAARARLAGLENVEIRSGRLEELPLDDGELDLALLVLVLHHVEDPARVFSEARRALAPGGRLLVVDMLTHDRSEYLQEMGHVWQGFSESQIASWLVEENGFVSPVHRALPADPYAKGPTLFVTSARRAAA